MALISHVRKNDTWIIDSGSSHHMTGDKTNFEHFEHYNGGSVRFGNNEPCYVKGKGFIILTKGIKCENAYWFEGLRHNLLSVAQLNNIGYKVEFTNGKAKLLDGKENPVGTGNQTKGNLFYLDLTKNTCLLAQIEEIWLWHKRMCHGNFDNLVTMSKKKRVRGIPNLKKPKMGMCKKCQIGKMSKISFRSKSFNSKEILELFCQIFVDQ